MATPLELTQMMKVLRAEVTALRDRVGALEAQVPTMVTSGAEVAEADSPKVESAPSVQAYVASPAPSRRMCPHCGVKPAYFFHVKNCRAKVA